MYSTKPVFVLWMRDLLRIWRDKMQLILLFITPLAIGFIGSAILSNSVNDYRIILRGLIVLTVLISAYYGGSSFVLDQDSGYLKELLAAPVSRASLIISRIITGASVSTISGVLALSCVPLFSNKMSIPGFLGAMGAIVFLALTVSSIGVMLGLVSNSIQAYYSVSILLVLLMFLLNSPMITMNYLDSPIARIALLNPVAYGSDLIDRALAAKSYFAAGASIAALSGFTLIFSLMSLYLLDRK